MKRMVLVVCLLSFCICTHAQTKKEFKRLWDKKISQNDILNDPEGFIKDLETYFLYKHDSIDFLLFMGPDRRNFNLYLMMMEISSDKTGLDKKGYVFRTIDSMFLEMKKEPDYPQARKAIVAWGILENKVVDVATWEEDKELLKQLNVNDVQLLEIEKLVDLRTGFGEGYVKLLQGYFAKEKKRKEAEKAKKQADFEKFWEMTPGCVAYIDNMDTVIMMAQEAKKPILIYYSCYGGVEPREMEMALIKHASVGKYIADHYVFAMLFMDSRTDISPEKRHFSDILGLEIKHMGHVNQEFQKKYFDIQKFPLLMIVTPDLKEVDRMEVTKDMDRFEKFLKQEK